MCLPEKCTASRGRSVVPKTRLRIRICRSLTRLIVAIYHHRPGFLCQVPPLEFAIVRFSLPSAGSVRLRIECLCPCKVLAGSRTEYPPQPDQQVACRFHQSKSSYFPEP